MRTESQLSNSFETESKIGANALLMNYLNKPIFNLLKDSNPQLYQRLTHGVMLERNDKRIVCINTQTGYLLDNGEDIRFIEIDKIGRKANLYRLNYNVKSVVYLRVGTQNSLEIDLSRTPSNDIIFEVSLANQLGVEIKPCNDYAGFALCYAGVLLSTAAMAASDGPLPFMDAVAATYLITQTANCHRSHC